MKYLERIKRLRDKAVSPDFFPEEHRLFFCRYLKENNLPYNRKTYSDAFVYAFSHLSVTIDEDELIVGKPTKSPSAEDKKEWDDIYWKMAVDLQREIGEAQDSHMAVDYEILLEQGINGILKRIEKLQKDCNEEQQSFYVSCTKNLQAVLILSNRYADHAMELAKTAVGKRKEELLKIADICRKVPANPPENFYEAVQSVNFLTYCLFCNPLRGPQVFQLGHPDRYLLPFYENDIKQGKLTKEEAQELLDCLGIQINNREPRGLSNGYMVGGRDENGKVVANDLTMMGLQVVDDVRLVYPAVGLCYHSEMPDEILEKACEILSHGCSHPAIFNDDIITAGLVEYGVPEKEARNYIHSSCVEITPVSSSNVWVASPYTNLAQILLDELNKEYVNFEELVLAIKNNLSGTIERNFIAANHGRKHRAQHSMIPLLSCFVNDCLELGTDIERGGARYNWIMPSFVGMANLVDSLYVIKKVVFEEKRMTMSELKAMLDKNFEDNEGFRLEFLNKYVKYGNDEDDVDDICSTFTEFIVDECKKHTPMHQNAHLIPSVFCWEKHMRFGKETGATPDGRKSGFPLGDGSGPCQGREKNGPTASILSSTKWSHKEFIGGVAVNMKFGKKQFDEHAIQNIKALIKTFIARGGFEMQINVVDRDTLIKAKENPEEYTDLVVRIGGYSDYFVKLSPNMQAEVIMRTEHGL